MFCMVGIMILFHSVLSFGVVILLFMLGGMFLLLELNFELCSDHLCGLMGGDVMSFGLIMLTWWLIMMMYLSSLGSSNSLSFVFMWLFMILCVVFVSLDVMIFYFMFEFILIPTTILIFGWGYQPERLGAGLYLFFYTIFCSMPLLLIFVLLMDSMMFMSALVMEFNGSLSGFMSVLGLLAFLVKVPLYGLHLWLPKAHVEAPISGSMILAGVLLKLGGYGLVRYLGYVFNIVGLWGLLFIFLSLWGSLYTALVCLRQVDLKSLIAYSSVVHMGFVLGGLFSGFEVGVMGAYIIMVGHGLCSSGIFYFSWILYSRVSSRSVFMLRGMTMLMPSGILLWFLIVSSNMSFPFSLNFFGEIILLGSLLGISLYLVVLLFLISFFGGVYCLYMYSWVQHGDLTMTLSGGLNLSVLEGLVMLMHWVPLNLLFFIGDLFTFI